MSRDRRQGSRYLTAAALAAVICFGGNSVLAGGLPKLPDNQYKMPDDLLAVCTVLHEEAGEGTVRVVFEPDFNLIVRQYDASFELVLDRDMVLTYQAVRINTCMSRTAVRQW